MQDRRLSIETIFCNSPNYKLQPHETARIPEKRKEKAPKNVQRSHLQPTYGSLKKCS